MAVEDPVDPFARIESLLRQELSVDPSPDFLPRVRERINTESRPARWSAMWVLVPGAAAAAIVLAVVLSLPRSQPGAVSDGTDAPVPATVAAPRVDPPSDASASAEVRQPPQRRGTARRESPALNSPVVIVDSRQRFALVSFVELVNKGQLTADALAPAGLPPEAQIEKQLTTIAVNAVAVSPIVVGGVLQQEIERK